MECNKLCYLSALIRPVVHHPVGPALPRMASGSNPCLVRGDRAWSRWRSQMFPLLLSSTWKLTEAMLGWSQPLTSIFDQWMVPQKGSFPTVLLSPASVPLMMRVPPHQTHTHTHTPLSSFSKAWATPNVTDVSLPIVHGWPHLNRWLVPRPAPYNGPLSHSDLFWAFAPSVKRGSLSPTLSLKVVEMEQVTKSGGAKGNGHWKVRGEVDHDRALAFINRTISMHFTSNYQHWGVELNQAFTPRLSVLARLIRQERSVLCSSKLWERKCALVALIKSDGKETVQRALWEKGEKKSHMCMLDSHPLDEQKLLVSVRENK